MVRLKLDRPLAFFDLETTGTNICKDRIIEISILKCMPNGDFISRTRRVNPTIHISADSTAIHGITNADVAQEPPFKRVAKSLVDFLEGCDFAGFNIVRFDLPLLVEELDRCGLELDLENRRFIDSQKIFFAKEPRNLAAAYKFYANEDIESLGKAHTAETDTMATYRVLQEQINRYKAEGLDSADPLRVDNDMDLLHANFCGPIVDLAGFLAYKNEKIIFNFGKHKGEEIKSIKKKEPSYLDWFLSKEFPVDSKRKLSQAWLTA